MLIHIAYAVDVAEVQAGIDALCVQVQRQGHDIDVAGALTVAEQCAFDAVGSCQQTKFGGCHGRPTVVVRVQADNRRFTRTQVAAEPFDLVGMHVRRRHLDGRGQSSG